MEEEKDEEKEEEKEEEEKEEEEGEVHVSRSSVLPGFLSTD